MAVVDTEDIEHILEVAYRPKSQAASSLGHAGNYTAPAWELAGRVGGSTSAPKEPIRQRSLHNQMEPTDHSSDRKWVRIPWLHR